MDWLLRALQPRTGHDIEGMYWRNNPSCWAYHQTSRPHSIRICIANICGPPSCCASCAVREFRGLPTFSASLRVDKVVQRNLHRTKVCGHSRQTLHAAASVASAGYFGRIVVVVDDDIDVTDMNDVMWAIFTRMDPERSIDIIKRALSSPLDPAIPRMTSATTRDC